MEQYRVVSENDLWDFETEVSKKIREGYIPSGSLIVTKYLHKIEHTEYDDWFFTQAMILKKELT